MQRNKKQKRKIVENVQSESSVGIQKLQEKATRTTENKFSKMLANSK